MRGRRAQIIGGLLCCAVVSGCAHKVVPTPPSATSESAPGRSLVGTQWRLDASKATFHISGTQLLATNGCQQLAATVAVHATSLDLADVRLSAGPYCPEVDVPGRRVFQVLDADSVSWGVQGDRLTVSDADGFTLDYRAD